MFNLSCGASRPERIVAHNKTIDLGHESATSLCFLRRLMAIVTDLRLAMTLGRFSAGWFGLLPTMSRWR